MPDFPPLICGIDPGQSGGIAFLDGRLVVPGFESVCSTAFSAFAYPMPETEKDVLDLIVEHEKVIKCAYLESVHSFPGQGVASSFTFGKGYGFLRGVLVARGIPFVDVSPMKWKKAIGLKFTAEDSKKDKKNGSKQLAAQWWPHIKVTHTISEALLICEYGRRQP